MLYLERAKKTLASKAISLQQFLKLHLTVEGLIKRLLFIGLRKNGVHYNTARQAIGEYYENSKKAIVKKAWNLCGIDYDTIVMANHDYAVMENLMLEFSSKYRNQLIHGNDGALHDTSLLKTLIHIDKKFIAAMEAVLKSQGKPSLFEQPRRWCLEKSSVTETAVVFQKFLGEKNKPNKPVMPLEEAQQQVSQVKFKL
jgi:hypothetical protein